MTLRRMLAIASLMLAAALGLAGPATAADYPVKPPAVTVSDPVVAPGATITIRAAGFRPDSEVVFRASSGNGGRMAGGLGLKVLATTVANSEGVATARIDLDGFSGDVLVAATGIAANGQPLTVTTTVQVRAGGAAGEDGTEADGTGATAADDATGGLAHTGGSLTALVAGGGLLLAGAVLVGVTRSRRRVQV